MKYINRPRLLILGAFVLSIGFGLFIQLEKQKENQIGVLSQNIDTENPIIKQTIEKVLEEPVEITKLYHENQLIGVVTDTTRIEGQFTEIYQREYEAQFPDSQLGYVQDVYSVQAMSYNVYENQDTAIFDYIYENKLIAIQVDKIAFSNGAIIYVKDKQDFIDARRQFILGYISEDAYETLINNRKITELATYGTQDIGFEVKESITISRGLATIDDIMLDESQILNFLSFGYTPDVKKYTVQEFDTIDGIAWLNEMSSNQLLSINKGIIQGSNQVLKPGTELNVAKFNSPLTVQVTQERLVSERVYPEPIIYREDPSLREGLTRVETKEEVGSADVRYTDVYQNDVSISSTKISSKTTKEPVRGIIYVGTYVEPKVGTGDFRWPMSNARLTCGWYCYANHQGADFQSRSNRGYGPIYAADRGVVVLNTYHHEFGYYIIIDHNNGFKTLYAHMEARGYFNVGETVRKGDQIGYVGMTGRTTGPHVHFEVHVNGVRRNPCTYLGC